MELPCPDIKSIHNALYIEHQVQRIITEQETNGILFDSARARRYITYLKNKQQQLYDSIRPTLSLQLTLPYNRPVSKPYLKAGGYSSQVTKWYGDRESSIVGGPFTRVSWVEPDLGSRQQLTAQLLHLGWRPAAFTEKGSPKLTVDSEPCPSLLSIGDEIGEWIAQWYIYRHRQSQIEGWLDLVRDDGRISAQAITIGTPTFRFRHRGVVNVPRASSLFGKQMRSLFRVPKGRKLVGHDASGLELRMLADAINDKTFTKEIIDGDIHTKNQKDAGLPNRDNAKTFIYAFIYGAGDAKIGAIVGASRRAGQQVRQKFLKANPRLKDCIETTQRAASRGYLIGLDGRRINMRRDKFTGEIQTHKALNTRLQAAGAIVMKWSMVILDHWVKEMGLDCKKAIDMHDESQNDVADKDAETVAALGPLSIKRAGELLKLNVPLVGESKIGINWAQTH